MLLKVVGQLPGSHELFHDLVRDLLAPGLVFGDQGLQNLYEDLLELTGEHGSTRVVLPDLLEPVIVLEEEGQVHEGHVHVTVASKLPVLLDGVSPSGKCVFVDLHQ